MGSRTGRGQAGFAVGVGALLAVAVWVSLAAGASVPEGGEERARQGAAIFGQRCGICHTMGRGVLIGPDLKGVTERRDGAWIAVQIKTPSAHRANNDPIAAANLAKFRMPMPDLGLSDGEVQAVIAYMAGSAETPRERPWLFVPTLAIALLAVAGLTVAALVKSTKRVEVRP